MEKYVGHTYVGIVQVSALNIMVLIGVTTP